MLTYLFWLVWDIGADFSKGFETSQSRLGVQGRLVIFAMAPGRENARSVIFLNFLEVWFEFDLLLRSSCCIRFGIC